MKKVIHIENKNTNPKKRMSDEPGSISAKQQTLLQQLLVESGSAYDGDIEALSMRKASDVIDELIKLKDVKRRPAQKTKNEEDESNSVDGVHTTPFLIGVAIKVAAYNKSVEYILAAPDQFEAEVVSVYQILSKARQRCLASSLGAEREQEGSV